MTWILKKLNEITYVQEGFLVNKNDSQLNGNFKRFKIRLTIDNHSRCYCKVLFFSKCLLFCQDFVLKKWIMIEYASTASSVLAGPFAWVQQYSSTRALGIISQIIGKIFSFIMRKDCAELEPLELDRKYDDDIA